MILRLQLVLTCEKAFDATRIADFASYPSLCMGLGNFLFVPLSMAIGRRCTLLLSNAILLASVIWAAKSESFESHLGARCLQGLTAGVSDCLVSVLDFYSIYMEFARSANRNCIATYHRLGRIFPTPS